MTDNKQSIDFYKTIANNINDAKDVKLLKSNDNTGYDIKFIQKYANKRKNLIDFGSGTGLIVNSLTDSFNEITAVELFKEFSNYISGKNITVINEDILNYKNNNKFELATMFGVAHHFNEDESLKIYKNIYRMLKNNGVFILKNQFGTNKTKTVTSSTEVGDNYFAQYRFLSFEIERLRAIGYADITTHNIYPDSENRWKDTHFYALVCRK